MTVETGRKIRQFAGGFKLRLLDENYNPVSGFIPLGGVTEFSVQPQFDNTDVPGYDIDNYGRNIAVIPMPKPSKVAVKGNTLSNAMMAFALAAKLGNKVVGTSGTVTGELHKGFNGQQIMLAHRSVSNEVLTAALAGLLVAGTDYEILPSPNSHWIEIKDQVLAAAGENISADYFYGAVDSITWTSGEKPILAEVIGDVQDRISGKYGMLRFARVQMSSSAVIDFVTTKDTAGADFEVLPFIDENGHEFTFTEFG